MQETKITIAEEKINSNKLNAYLINVRKQALKLSGHIWVPAEQHKLTNSLYPLTSLYLEALIGPLEKELKQAKDMVINISNDYFVNNTHENWIKYADAYLRFINLNRVINTIRYIIEDRIRDEIEKQNEEQQKDI